MLRASLPTRMGTAFAASAGGGFVETIPVAPSPTPGKASFTLGFPPATFELIAAGGTPPWGADMNGILYAVTLWLQWAQAGGFPIRYDSAFSTSIGGYPQYAVLMSSSPGPFGKMWLSTVDNNTTDPDGGGAANWVLFPDVLIQRQKNNYAADTGATNAVTVDLGIRPASWAAIVGMPIRIKALHANTVNNPTLIVQGSSGPLAPATMVNPGGAVLGIGQFTVNDIIEGLPKDDGTFQVNSPVPVFSPTGTFPPPGFIMPWATETPPSGFIECNGAALLISSYPNLWAVLGTRYGGDGVNTFRVPDYRGEFLRGWDHGRGLDPNAASRTNAGGGLTGDHVGTNQPSALKGTDLNGATVTIRDPLAPAPLAPGVLFSYGGLSAAAVYAHAGNQATWGDNQSSSWPDIVDHVTGVITISGSGAETRPVNIYVMWVMFTG